MRLGLICMCVSPAVRSHLATNRDFAFLSQKSSLVVRYVRRRVCSISFRDTGCIFVAFVKDDSVAQVNAFAIFQSESTGLGGLVEALRTKRVCREEPIVPNVPPCWMTKARRVVQERNTKMLTLNRSVVVHPSGALRPRFAVAIANTIDDMSLAVL